jgi:uncharacterized protein
MLMNADAQEAALGLLGLSPANYQPLIPQKRKQSPPPPPSLANPDSINCICGFSYDDGFSIACDDCERWCHAACFDIVEGEVPEEWRCWVCVPRPVDADRARMIQQARADVAASGFGGFEKASNHRRRSSPGVEKKQRRVSNAIEGSKRKHHRRMSFTQQPSFPPPSPLEDEHVDIDVEPWTHSYVPITTNFIPDTTTRDNLRKQAQHWRGVTAFQSSPHPLSHNSTPIVLGSPLPTSTPTRISPLPPSHFPHSTTSILPPSYYLHTTHPIASSSLITPYTSTVTPSSAYLSDPLNAYAGLGVPKPYVHLFGPPLDVAVDARISGSESRFARNGCRPNAVLRPVICPREDTEESSLEFALFALRDLKANEEVVLGWEWDDNHAIHQLPAIISSPHMFP